MRTYAVVGVVLVVILFAVWPARAENCEDCEDLCRLMDQYVQKQAGIKMWKQYASSTPEELRRQLPVNVNELPDGVEDIVWWEFYVWGQHRKLPCVQNAGDANGDQPVLKPRGKMVTDAVTHWGTCEVLYNNQKLEGDNRKQFEKDVGCKTLSDAVIAHENLHREHCLQVHSQGPQKAKALLDDPSVTAESELKAWTLHKDMIADQIRKIIHDKKCGWDPTERQMLDPNAMPTPTQIKQMQERDWQAVSSLWSK